MNCVCQVFWTLVGLNLDPKCVSTHWLCDSGHVTWSFSLESGDTDCTRSDIKCTQVVHSGYVSARAQPEPELMGNKQVVT